MLRFIFLNVPIFLLLSCSKAKLDLQSKIPDAGVPFTKYTIAAGQQFCNDNVYNTTSYSELKFLAKFDSSAIYITLDPGRQNDINKLYGFSDNNTTHHLFSARFGWRWSNNA